MVACEQIIQQNRTLLERGEQKILERLDWEFGGQRSTQTMGNEGFDVHEDLSQKIEQLKIVRPLAAVYAFDFDGIIDGDTLGRHADRLKELSPRVHKGRAEIILNDGIRNLESVATEVLRFENERLPKSFVYVLCLLIWLSGTGVVWPLIELTRVPGMQGRLLMLFAVGAGLFAFIAYLAYTVIEIWRLGRLKW